MNSRTAVLEMVPTRVVPKAARSDADDAIFLASSYGLTPDAWQEDVLRAWLALRPDGSWASSTCVLAVARQNGKNALIEIRELFGMVVLGEKFLHTAHEVKTARKAFLRLASFFENPKRYPELASLAKEIRKTNGQEAIILTNGGSVEFVARSKGSGRGFTVDCLVFDEAQDLSDEALAALLPTISAAPLGNPQRIITGAPPSGTMNGEVLLRTRRNALSGKNPRLCLIDYGCEGPLPDVNDRSEWEARNPAVASGRLQMATIMDEHSTMDAETFARERLCWWGDPDFGGGAFAAGAWAARSSEGGETAPGALGIAVDVERNWLSLAVASRDGIPHVAPVLRAPRENASAFVAEVRRIQRKYRTLPVAIDKRGPASFLIPDLDDAGVRLTLASLEEYVQACADMEAAVNEGGLTHGDYPELNAAVSAATWRDVGDRRAFGRKKGDISMLEAATLAVWAAKRAALTYSIQKSIY